MPVQHSLPEKAVLRRAVERYPAYLKQFLADRLLSDLGEGPWDEASIAQERRWATVQRQRWRQALATLDLRLASRALAQALAFEGFNVSWEEARQAPPAWLLAAVQAEVGHAGLRLRLRRLEGRWNPLEAASSPPGPAGSAKTLAEVLEAYHKERHFSAQRLEEMRTLVRRVGEVCGAGLPVAAFGPAHMLGCKQARMAMPWRMTAAERALPLPELVRRYEGQDVERVSLVTVQKDLGLLAPLFD